MKVVQRCDWSNNDILNKYHDNEWCVINHDDKYIFEMLLLESMQAGLNWLTILNKRKAFSKAFDNFDFEKISKYDDLKIDQLINNSNIIRNKLKINSSITNAKSFIKLKKEYKTFDKYIWSFVNNQQIVNQWEKTSMIPTQTELSIKISNDLKKRGFKFVGPVTIYSFLQSIGIIDDHLKTCFKSKS